MKTKIEIIVLSAFVATLLICMNYFGANFK